MRARACVCACILIAFFCLHVHLDTDSRVSLVVCAILNDTHTSLQKVLGIEFVPATTFASQVFYGLLVEKRLSALLPNGTIVPIKNIADASLSPGTLIQVDIQVTAEDDQPGGIILDDFLPAPFQAHDPNLPQPQRYQRSRAGGGAGGGASLEEEKQQQEEQPPPPPGPMPPSGGSPFDPYAWWPNDPSMWSFQRIEVYKDKVQCSTPYALAGTLMCSYTAEVVTSGAHFVLPPAHAYSITDPGTMGLSAAANFTVDRL